jgi:hypothetical protein
MAKITRIPAGLDVTCGIGDVFSARVFLTQNGEPIDVTDWEFQASNVQVAVLDAVEGKLEITFNEDISKLNDWFIRRISPNPKRLLAGFIQFVSTAGNSTDVDAVHLSLPND